MEGRRTCGGKEANQQPMEQGSDSPGTWLWRERATSSLREDQRKEQVHEEGNGRRLAQQRALSIKFTKFLSRSLKFC